MKGRAGAEIKIIYFLPKGGECSNANCWKMSSLQFIWDQSVSIMLIMRWILMNVKLNSCYLLILKLFPLHVSRLIPSEKHLLVSLLSQIYHNVYVHTTVSSIVSIASDHSINLRRWSNFDQKNFHITTKFNYKCSSADIWV